ncbi:MAG: hypothetical protein ABR574_10325, partial [Cryomorphaceae bacterium]
EIKIYADWLGMDEPKLIGDLRSERVEAMELPHRTSHCVKVNQTSAYRSTPSQEEHGELLNILYL